MAEFFANLLRMIRPMLACHQITLVCDLHACGFWYIDPDPMQTAALNLVYNARDAMPNGGVLTIASRLERDQILLEFTDTGCGMAPELVARFREPFVTEGKPHGTGLGMVVVQEILNAYHAQLDVHSLVGQGTTIRIRLPVQP